MPLETRGDSDAAEVDVVVEMNAVEVDVSKDVEKLPPRVKWSRAPVQSTMLVLQASGFNKPILETDA